MLENAPPDVQGDERDQSATSGAPVEQEHETSESGESGLTKAVDLFKEPTLTDPACSGYFVEPVSMPSVISVATGLDISLSVKVDGPLLERWLAFWEDNLSQSEMQSEAWELRLGWSSLWV